MSACLVADSIWFLAGRIYGSGVMKLLCRLSLTPDSCVSNTQARFERLGINAVLISKFVPGLSLIAPPLAGAIRMGWLRFLTFDAISATALQTQGGIAPNDLAAIKGASAEVGEIDQRQAERIAALQRRLGL